MSERRCEPPSPHLRQLPPRSPRHSVAAGFRAACVKAIERLRGRCDLRRRQAPAMNAWPQEQLHLASVYGVPPFRTGHRSPRAGFWIRRPAERNGKPSIRKQLLPIAGISKTRTRHLRSSDRGRHQAEPNDSRSKSERLHRRSIAGGPVWRQIEQAPRRIGRKRDGRQRQAWDQLPRRQGTRGAGIHAGTREGGRTVGIGLPSSRAAARLIGRLSTRRWWPGKRSAGGCGGRPAGPRPPARHPRPSPALPAADPSRPAGWPPTGPDRCSRSHPQATTRGLLRGEQPGRHPSFRARMASSTPPFAADGAVLGLPGGQAA